uniref:Uncharacterized protein n=1 Tax=Megaselia scalaris TaxID=36166 RepID=T1GE54_MEGSC
MAKGWRDAEHDMAVEIWSLKVIAVRIEVNNFSDPNEHCSRWLNHLVFLWSFTSLWMVLVS